MKEAWKAFLRAMRDFIRGIISFALKPLVKALKAVGECCIEWAESLGKI